MSQGTWATNGGGLFTCALGDINPNGSATISIVVRPDSAGSISNAATVSSGISDPNISNNTAMAVTAANEAPPTITAQPEPQNVCPGATATFTVAATGAGPLSYQWQTNDINLTNGGHYDGVTRSNLTVSGADSTVLGDYRCVVSNQGGSTTSSAAALTISDTTPPWITCPTDVTVSADAGTCGATNVALGSPVTGDNCGVAGVTNDGLGSYPLGTNLVTWTVTDTSGNTNSCQQQVVVLDAEAPTIVWYLTNVVVAAGTNCQAADAGPDGDELPHGGGQLQFGDGDAERGDQHACWCWAPTKWCWGSSTRRAMWPIAPTTWWWWTRRRRSSPARPT